MFIMEKLEKKLKNKKTHLRFYHPEVLSVNVFMCIFPGFFQYLTDVFIRFIFTKIRSHENIYSLKETINKMKSKP